MSARHRLGLQRACGRRRRASHATGHACGCGNHLNPKPRRPNGWARTANNKPPYRLAILTVFCIR